jgi:hypothetical protein
MLVQDLMKRGVCRCEVEMLKISCYTLERATKTMKVVERRRRSCYE